MSRFDAWWRRIGQLAAGVARIIAFYLGTRIFLLATSDRHEKPWLYVAALLLMGVPAAGVLERLVGLGSRLLSLLEQQPEKRHDNEEGRGD